ncbi:conserved hypothetical protein [Anaeromyxobacter dehalogenans 2CP-1]|uniref:Uncharacterized protein n=1 Tax=Anaeromyxobacter dehalogenans (strain ATCC BAA-258 / DSM 21875 / 2CP-1) TaxID=455488 RepID=B8JAK9_ANAD2|nr:hypothetical protein [Anaeromyxobacter dehalogenans]ACL67508.1 conserved hypothetical protein [Anaeromyxobacter dehalogenans 2CP-1]
MRSLASAALVAALAALISTPAAAQPLPAPGDVEGWTAGLSTGVAGRFGGFEIDPGEHNPPFLILVGARAEGWFPGRLSQAVRLRARVLAGGEDRIFVPSDGELEAAWAIGYPEFRFVLGRVEAARAPGLALQSLVQLGTLPSVEGNVTVGYQARLDYLAAPVEMVHVRYRGRAHLPGAGATTESEQVHAASAARLRYTVEYPAGPILSVQAEALKLWEKPDLLAAAEGSVGWAAFGRAVVFEAVARWQGFTRRAPAPDDRRTDGEVQLLAVARIGL